MEYDASEDRWTLLHTNPTLSSRFDEHGRRWLVNHRCSLMYDGDPFSPEALDPKVATALSEILKLMDHKEWRIREEATARLKQLYPEVRDRLEAASKDESFSPEVRWRLKTVLARPTALRGLLLHSHPPVKPVGRGDESR